MTYNNLINIIKDNNKNNDDEVLLFSANKILATNEIELINKKVNSFIENWYAHENKVDANISILFDFLIVITINNKNSDLSGCGRDKLFNLLKEIGNSFNIDFFDRFKIPIFNKNKFYFLNFQEIKLFKKYNDNSFMFNLAINKGIEFNNNLLQTI